MSEESLDLDERADTARGLLLAHAKFDCLFVDLSMVVGFKILDLRFTIAAVSVYVLFGSVFKEPQIVNPQS